MKMKQGALVMMDALGFKGIWRRENPADVISKLESLKASVTAEAIKHRGYLRQFEDDVGELPFEDADVDVAFLSDTIVFGVSCRDAFMSLHAASALASIVIAHAAKGTPVLAFRGSIAHGTYIIAENFIIGEAVDDAAKHMDLAEGAFVWFTPSANLVLGTAGFYEPMFNDHAHRYRVPLKGGSSYETTVISPFYAFGSVDRAPLVDSILGTFTRDEISIDIKRQNTAEFLRMVDESMKSLDALVAMADSKKS